MKKSPNIFISSLGKKITGFFLVLLISFVGFFQNCSQTNFLDTSSFSSDLSSQNGEPYVGLSPQTTFYKNVNDVIFLFPHPSSNANHYLITPDLPNGLILDIATGTISGTPSDTTLGYISYSISEVENDQTVSTITENIGVGFVYQVDSHLSDLGLRDANLSDGICADVNGVCSLQAALDQAAANPVKTRILLPPGHYLLAATPLRSSANIEINGAGPGITELSGEDIAGVINLTGSDVSLKNLSITHGNLVGSELGAGIKYANANGFLELSNIELAYNQITTASSGGGGLYFSGIRLAISDSHIHHNVMMTDTVAGTFPGGGGIYVAAGLCEIKDSFLEDNSAQGMGGAIFGAARVQINLNDDVFARNSANYDGGAVSVGLNNAVNIRRSAFIANQSAGEGGAILWKPFVLGIMNIDDSTFGQNKATNGGAFSTSSDTCDSQASWPMISSSTFAENIATNSDGGAVFRLGRFCRLKLQNSLVGINTGTNCDLDTALIDSQGFNISADFSCELAMPNDLNATDPQLGGLTSIGRTYVYPLMSTSPAIDTGDPSACPLIDQRGLTRPQGLRCDVGAFEF